VPPFEEEEEVEAIMCARASVAIILSCFVCVCSNIFPHGQSQNDEKACVKLFDKMTRDCHTKKNLESMHILFTKINVLSRAIVF